MNPLFKRKLTFTVPILILLVLLAQNAGRPLSYTIGLIASFSAVLLMLYFKYRKEHQKPTHFADERAIAIAYKADSMTLRTLLVCMALLFFIESIYHIGAYITLYGFIGFMLGVGLLLKVTLFYYLNWKS